ncbi:MAG TPA: hypothetical protein V6D09_22125 [Leptolyngbyaceae cyanobacterium]
MARYILSDKKTRVVINSDYLDAFALVMYGVVGKIQPKEQES